MEKLKTTYRLEYFGISDTGLVRKTNQDVWDCDPKVPLFLLADGMGGHKAGEIAAAECIRSILSHVQEAKEEEPDLVTLYKRVIMQANRKVYDLSRKEKKYEGMGTTLALVAFAGNQVVIAHVGDSRIYRIRNQELEQMTDDHSLAQELLSLGTAHSEDGQLAPFKNVLTRAVGTYPTVEPTLEILDRLPQDLYLLCSDGLTNYATDEQIKKIILHPSSLSERAGALVTLAKQQGGGDNITLILVQCKD